MQTRRFHIHAKFISAHKRTQRSAAATTNTKKRDNNNHKDIPSDNINYSCVRSREKQQFVTLALHRTPANDKCQHTHTYHIQTCTLNNSNGQRSAVTLRCPCTWQSATVSSHVHTHMPCDMATNRLQVEKRQYNALRNINRTFAPVLRTFRSTNKNTHAGNEETELPSIRFQLQLEEERKKKPKQNKTKRISRSLPNGMPLAILFMVECLWANLIEPLTSALPGPLYTQVSTGFGEKKRFKFM